MKQSKDNLDDLLEEAVVTPKTRRSRKKNWTLITAFEAVHFEAEDSGLLPSFFVRCKAPLDYLTSVLPFSSMACIFLTVMLDEESAVTTATIAKHLGISRINFLTHKSAFDELISKRWIVSTHDQRHFSPSGQYRLAEGLVEAVSNNEVFVPENLHCETIPDFLEMMFGKYERLDGPFGIEYEDFVCWLMPFLSENKHIPLVTTMLSYKEVCDIAFFAYVICDYLKYAGTENEGLHLLTVQNSFQDGIKVDTMCRNLMKMKHPFIIDGWIEPNCVDSSVDNTRFLLTRKTKNELLDNYVSPFGEKGNIHKDQNIRKCTDVKPKTLFYQDEDKKQVEQLVDLLKEDNFVNVQGRLMDKGLRSGFACLFYGGPGTGKTETVYQIARLTGRDIFQVDISCIRDKWVGESEKNIKAAFDRYRNACKNSDIKPILFFNEADAIFGCRIEGVNHSVDQMNNTMQNIILQEMEDLDGILIATTNIANNLDAAFERRFIFKINFHKPDPEAKAKIWSAMISDISDSDAHQLADEFDFSGGQIENISRKCLVEYILNGVEPNLSRLRELCRAETIVHNKGNHRVIGF